MSIIFKIIMKHLIVVIDKVKVKDFQFDVV